jgi:hypothetical protein
VFAQELNESELSDKVSKCIQAVSETGITQLTFFVVKSCSTPLEIIEHIDVSTFYINLYYFISTPLKLA